MYYQYFGLNEAPFSIAVNPRYLFMSARHRDALAHLLYGVGAGGGFILLTGEVGTGKTTINRCLLEQLPPSTDIAIILNPALNAMELLASACDELGIDYDHQQPTLKSLTDNLHKFLLDNHSRGRSTVLLIDEAQHLDFNVLEQIRLLTNLETNSEKLLQIILIGQPELSQMLARPELRQLNQRITARYNLQALDLAETGAYIRHRLQVAGLAPDRDLFPASVVRRIHRRTRGIPRLINVLCDRVLLGTYGRNKARAENAMVDLAAKEVMGEGAAGSNRYIAWSLAALAALALVFMLAWYALLADDAAPLNSSMPSDSVLDAPVASPPGISATAGKEGASTPIEGTSEGVDTNALQQSQNQSQGDALTWLMPPEQALSELWALSSSEVAPENICAGELAFGLACVTQSARTWDALGKYNRPVLLQMVTPDKFGAAVIVLGMTDRQANIYAAGTVLSVSLAELGPLWTGTYRYLWHPPQGYEKPLGTGDTGIAVAAVAALFAQLDGQSLPLATRRFNAALEQRVRIFQRQNSLREDGFVGVMTLLKLNELLAIDTTVESVQQSLMPSGGRQ